MKTPDANTAEVRSEVDENAEGGWHSWDAHPWKHPWLTSENLGRMKEFSRVFLEHQKWVLDRIDPNKLKIAFCGNIANCMYVRAVPLRRAGMTVDLFLHPQDSFVMSQPGWEEYDGIVEDGHTTLEQLEALGQPLPDVSGVYRYPERADWRTSYEEAGLRFLRSEDVGKYPSYVTNIDSLTKLQSYDVLWGTQVPYLAYLANRPYVVSQMGGDFWLEASRNDQLGRVMRASFANARVNLASNPWVFANARRMGMNNVVYLPKIIDQDVYSPATDPGPFRAEWKAQSRGSFFVLTSSRLDERSKGSSIGIEGFAKFSRTHPKARLVFFGWGNDRPEMETRLETLGIQDKVIRLPITGKARLRDALRSADVFMDQFVVGYFGSAGMEAMACGLPTIGRIEVEQYEALCETGPPPILNADKAADVVNHLAKLYFYRRRRIVLGAETRQWFVDNHGSERWLKEYMGVLAATAVSMPTDFSASPLAEPLSRGETSYHERNLKAAPPYPNYGW